MLIVTIWGRRVTRISGSMIWSKTLMELIFNPCGEFRCSPEGPVSQIHSTHLHVGAHGNFSDRLRPVQMLKRGWGAENNGKLPHLFIPSKTTTFFPEFTVDDLPLGRAAAFNDWVCSERPALGQNTLMLQFWFFYCVFYTIKIRVKFELIGTLISEIRIFKLILICKFQNIPCALGFEVKYLTFFCISSGHV